MEEVQLFLDEVYYGNSIAHWLSAFGIFLTSIILARIIYWFLSRILKIFTQKTANPYDDVIIAYTENPIIALIIMYGFIMGINMLEKDIYTEKWFENSFALIKTLGFTWLIAMVIDALLEAFIIQKTKKSEGNLTNALLPVAKQVLNIIIYTVGFILALNNAGYNVATLLTGLGLGGLAFAIASRDTITNIFGGVTILVNQPFKLMDRIKVGKFDGYVVGIGLTKTTLQIFVTQTKVFIPNKTFISKEIVNISAANALLYNYQVNLSYENSADQIEKAITIIKDIILENPSIEDNCNVFIQNLGDISIAIQVDFYIKFESNIWDTQSQVAIQILKQLKENEIRTIIRGTVKVVGDENTSGAKSKKTKSNSKSGQEDDTITSDKSSGIDETMNM